MSKNILNNALWSQYLILKTRQQNIWSFGNRFFI